MTTPNLLPGNHFRVYRADATVNPGGYAFICLATSKTLTLTNEYEDATVPDCDNPTGIPNRKSIVKSRSWGGRIAGKVDALRFQKLYADTESETPVGYQFLIDKPAAQGGGTFTGGVLVENLEITSTDNGIVSFTLQFRGDDALVYAAVAS